MRRRGRVTHFMGNGTAVPRFILMLLLLTAVPPPTWADDQGRARFDIEDYRGHVVLLDFWASWCAPCRESFPWMNQLYDRYGDRPFRIVAISVDTEEDLATRFLEEFDPQFEVIRDPTGQVAARYGVFAMPTSVPIDAQGNVIKKHYGFDIARSAEYEAQIEDALSSLTNP